MRQVWRLLGLAAMSASLSLAQQAALSGYVKDPTGAVVPRAGVTIIKTDTSAKWSTSSGDIGFYEFPALPPGLTRCASKRQDFSRWFAEASRSTSVTGYKWI